MKDLIARCENAILYEEPVAETRTFLVEAGLTDYEAWLTYRAAQVAVRMRERFDVGVEKKNTPL